MRTDREFHPYDRRAAVPGGIQNGLARDANELLTGHRVDTYIWLQVEDQLLPEAISDFFHCLRERNVKRLVEGLGERGDGAPRIGERSLGGVGDRTTAAVRVFGAPGASQDEGELLRDAVVEVPSDAASLLEDCNRGEASPVPADLTCRSSEEN